MMIYNDISICYSFLDEFEAAYYYFKAKILFL